MLIGLNLAVFLATVVLGRSVPQQLSLVGNRFFFADAVGESFGVAGGAYWRLLTSAFLHVEIWHLAINMFSLWVLGPPLERLLGRLRCGRTCLHRHLLAAVACEEIPGDSAEDGDGQQP